MKLTKEQKVKLYTNMIRTRKVDEFFVSAFDEKKLAGAFFHSQQGQEAVGTGFYTFLRQDDYLFNSHRGHGIAELISKGVPINKIIAEHYGKVTGTCRGMGYMYTCSLEHGVFGMVGTLGGEAPLAAGVALAAKFRDQGQVVAFVSSDGAMGEGAIHEALLMIANWKLPVVVVASNNQYQMWVPTSAAYPKENIADLAFGYGIPAEVVDGQDVMAVFEAVQTATDRARAGKGPSFIECKTYHFRSHMEGSPQYIVDKIRGCVP